MRIPSHAFCFTILRLSKYIVEKKTKTNISRLILLPEDLKAYKLHTSIILIIYRDVWIRVIRLREVTVKEDKL